MKNETDNNEFFLKDFIYFIFRGGEREKERERNKGRLPLIPTGDLAGNPGMYLDWQSNQKPFGSQASAQSTEPYQPGPIMNLKSYKQIIHILLFQLYENIIDKTIYSD